MPDNQILKISDLNITPKIVSVKKNRINSSIIISSLLLFMLRKKGQKVVLFSEELLWGNAKNHDLIHRVLILSIYM